MPPYPQRYGGCVLSATIDRYAYVSLRRNGTERIRVDSQDTGKSAVFDSTAVGTLSGEIDLAEAIFRRFQTTGIDCFMHSDAPPGSGLGSSSAMIVALITALSHENGLHLSVEEVAELAILVERADLGIAGGLQDQYACSFGGFNFIEFSADGTYVTPLRLAEETISELHYHLLLCYTGKTRLSSNIISEQTANVTNSSDAAIKSLAEIKDTTLEMKRLLLKGRLVDFANLLDYSWMLKRRLASGITTPFIDELYEAAKAAGAAGGKILGAGGGGHLLLFTPFNRRHRVAERMEQLGARVVAFQFDGRGARSWNVTSDLWPS